MYLQLINANVVLNTVLVRSNQIVTVDFVGEAKAQNLIERNLAKRLTVEEAQEILEGNPGLLVGKSMEAPDEVPVADAPEPQLDAGELAERLIAGTVDTLRSLLPAVDSLEVLDLAIEAEANNKDRASAIAAIELRIDELAGD